MKLRQKVNPGLVATHIPEKSEVTGQSKYYVIRNLMYFCPFAFSLLN